MPIESQPPSSLDKTKEIESNINMSVFRVEIEVLIDERKKYQADKVQTHLGMIELIDVNIADLTEADAIMWYKAKNFTKGLIAPQDINIPAYVEDIRVSGGNISRTNFLQVIANMFQGRADYFK